MAKIKDEMERESHQVFDDSESSRTAYRYFDEKGQHLHTFEGKPLIGASSPMKVIAKPLTWWAAGHAVKALGISDPKVITKIKNKKASEEEVKAMYASVGVSLEKIKNMSVEEFYKLLDTAYRAHDVSLDKSADEGTDLHAELERFVKDEMAGENRLPEAYNKRIFPFIEWARENVKEYLWSEIHSYSVKHWIGGISDLGLVDNKGRKAVFDFKSSKEAYQTQFWQCAGYDIEIEESGGVTADGYQVFGPGFKADYYAIVPFGAEVIRPYTNEEVGARIGMDMSVEACRAGFLSALDLYKRLPRE